MKISDNEIPSHIRFSLLVKIEYYQKLSWEEVLMLLQISFVK